MRYIGTGFFAIGTITWIGTEFFVPDLLLKGAQENLNRAILKSYIYRESLLMMAGLCNGNITLRDPSSL